jgi:hypothetical protein
MLIFRCNLSSGVHRLVQQITPGGDACPSVAASSYPVRTAARGM